MRCKSDEAHITSKYKYMVRTVFEELVDNSFAYVASSSNNCYDNHDFRCLDGRDSSLASAFGSMGILCFGEVDDVGGLICCYIKAIL